MTELSSFFHKLSLKEKSAISLDDVEDDYVLDLATQQKISSDVVLAATSSNYSIRLYNRSNLATLGQIAGHENVITGIKFLSTEPDLLFSSSTDKTVRCWDLRLDYKKPAQTFQGFRELNNLFTSFDINCTDRVICAGTEAVGDEVHIIFWDRRKATPLGCYNECHQDDITQVCFPGNNPDRMATASTDGLVCVFDISQASEDDALVTILNSQSSVGRLGWCGDHCENIFCVTHVDTFHLWQATEGDVLCEIMDAKEKLQGDDSIEYLVDCIPDISSPTSLPFIVAGTHSGNVKILKISPEDDTLEVVSSLTPGHKATVRCCQWDPESKSLVTGGEDSLLCLWSSVDSVRTSHTPDSKEKLKMASKTKSKSKPY